MAKDRNKLNKNGKIDQELKKALDKQEREELLFKANELLPKENFDAKLEQHQLRNGTKFTIKQVEDLIKEQASDYFPMFPNRKPFFKLMYKRCGWDHLDPNDFIKPPIVAVWIKKYIYGRFNADVLLTLLKIENPLISGHIKKYKLFQFLNANGIALLEGYIQDAIAVLEVSDNWYDFELKYTKLYNLPVQLRLIK